MIDSANRGALKIKNFISLPTDNLKIFLILSSPAFLGVVSVTTMFSRTEFYILSKALPLNNPVKNKYIYLPCVAKAKTWFAP